MIKLLGIVLIAVGFALRWNALLVVLLAGITTGMLAGFSFRELMQLTGQYFIDNRGLTLPVALMLPIVGLLEKHGLQQRVASLMRRAKTATPGGVLWLYQAVRGGLSMVGISLGNHASMVRPLVVPMAEAIADKDGTFHRDNSERIRAHAAASENVGNFFADDIFVAVGALLLVHGTLKTAGVEVRLLDVQLWSAPTAIAVLAIGGWRYRALNRKLRETRASGTDRSDRP